MDIKVDKGKLIQPTKLNNKCNEVKNCSIVDVDDFNLK